MSRRCDEGEQGCGVVDDGCGCCGEVESRNVVMEVRNADSLSVNPGPRPGLGRSSGLHRDAVPLATTR